MPTTSKYKVGDLFEAEYVDPTKRVHKPGQLVSIRDKKTKDWLAVFRVTEVLSNKIRGVIIQVNETDGTEVEQDQD